MPACGCVGPNAVRLTRMRYNEVFRATNDEQILLNIVRLRYADSPTFIDLPNITSQFEVGARSNYLGGYGNQVRGPASLGFGEMTLRDTPTLSYHPREGREIAKALLTPISTDLLSAVNAGANVEQLLLLTINDLNDVPNAPRAATLTPDFPDQNQEYLRGIKLLAWIRDHDGAELALGTDEETESISDPIPAAALKGTDLIEAAKEGYAFRSSGKGQVTLHKREKDLFIKIRRAYVNSPEMAELARIFRLTPGLDRYRIRSELAEEANPKGPRPLSGDTIYLNMRSIIQIMTFLSKGVCVPGEHVAAGVAPSTIGEDGRVFDWTQVTDGNFRVLSQKQRPRHAEVAVYYRSYWFFIPETDPRSRASLSILEILFALQDSDAKQAGPVLTLPLGGG
jgi:hypothetical protein